MTITLTPKESEDYFYNALCNGLGYVQGYGIGLDYDEIEFGTAKLALKDPCFEDVLMQILRDGGRLTMVDYEGEGDMTRSICLADVHEMVGKTDPKHLLDMVNENDDAVTADVIIQTVFYKELVFA